MTFDFSWLSELTGLSADTLLTVAASLPTYLFTLWRLVRWLVPGRPVVLSEMARLILAQLDQLGWEGGGDTINNGKVWITPAQGWWEPDEVWIDNHAIQVTGRLTRAERKLIFTKARAVQKALKQKAEALEKQKVLNLLKS
jgi:hypothetical protein